MSRERVEVLERLVGAYMELLDVDRQLVYPGYKDEKSMAHLHNERQAALRKVNAIRTEYQELTGRWLGREGSES
jgi:hypothetical protein